jgi:hypothetical protein
MTHLYIKLCDNCRRPCEVDGGLHGGTIQADILVKKGKVSHTVFREEFDLCITCIQNTGLADTLQKLKLVKDENKQKKLNFRKELELKKVLGK